MLIVGAGRIEAGTLTTGALVAYLLYIDLFFAPVQQLSQVFDGYQQATVSLGRIQELLQEPTSTPRRRRARSRCCRCAARSPSRTCPSRYGDDGREAPRRRRPAHPGRADRRLRRRDRRGQVDPGQAGRPLLRPDGGRVTVDGTDLRDLDLTAYRHRLGVVPQEAYLFPGTVRDAIAYGRPGASDAEVEAAARAVGAHDMIATLDGGYLHEVAERGRNLSAGQRQLIALARAELVDPDVLLLDEATAALDLATEAQVNQATDRLDRPPHDPGRRPPAHHRRPRRPGRRHGPRPGRRGRHARRAAGARGPVRRAVADVHREQARAGGAGRRMPLTGRGAVCP